MTPPSKWLFFPTQTTGPLQTITWNMTGASTATVSSIGAAIINTSKTTQLAWQPGKCRFWNGSAAVSAANYNTESGGLYYFTSSTTSRDWWCLYGVSATLNGGPAIDLNALSTGGSGGSRTVTGAVYGSCQTSYINCVIATKGSAFISGDTVVLTVTAL